MKFTLVLGLDTYPQLAACLKLSEAVGVRRVERLVGDGSGDPRMVEYAFSGHALYGTYHHRERSVRERRTRDEVSSRCLFSKPTRTFFALTVSRQVTRFLASELISFQ